MIYIALKGSLEQALGNFYFVIRPHSFTLRFSVVCFLRAMQINCGMNTTAKSVFDMCMTCMKEIKAKACASCQLKDRQQWMQRDVCF